MTAVATQPGERDENFPRVGHDTGPAGIDQAGIDQTGVTNATSDHQQPIQIGPAGSHQERGLVDVERFTVPGPGKRPTKTKGLTALDAVHASHLT